MRVGDALQIDHIHWSQGLPAHDMLFHPQLRRPQAAADQGGVGPDALHKGISCALQGRFVFRLPHRAFFLGGYGEGQRPLLAGEKHQTAPRHQVCGPLVQAGPHLHAAGVQRPLVHDLVDLMEGEGSQHRVLGQGPEHIVVHPLSPDHALDPAKVNASFQVAVQDDGPGSEIRAVLKDFLNILRRQGAGEPGFFPGVWYAVHKNPPPLFWIVFQVSGKKSVKTKFSCLPSRFNVLI